MLNRAKFLGVVSGLAVLVVACSDGNQTATNTTEQPTGDKAANVSTNTAAQKPATTATNISSLGVKDASEIKFQTPPPTVLIGFFDAVNNSGGLKHNASKSGTIRLSGWAIVPEKAKPAETVIITTGDNNQIVAIAPVNIARPDVVKAVKGEGYKNSGWSTAVKGDSLPAGRVLLKAWTYDPATKTATQLKNIHELTVAE